MTSVNTHSGTKGKGDSGESYENPPYETHNNWNEPNTPVKVEEHSSKDEERLPISSPSTVWIRCDVYDTGIGIPGFRNFLYDLEFLPSKS